MASRLQCFILALPLVLLSTPLLAQNSAERALEDIVSPDLQRREINQAKIDSEIFELGFFAGLISIEDFGTNTVYGGRLAIHVTEDLFVEATLGRSALQETSYETLSGDTRLLSDAERRLTYYNLALGVNLFPGELYLGRWAFNNSFYLLGGAGNSLFADNEYFTYHFGGGLRLFLTDWLALRVDVRNHVLTHNLFGVEKSIQNLETHMGLTVYF